MSFGLLKRIYHLFHKLKDLSFGTEGQKAATGVA
jgi:hypothetical protein